MHVAKATCAFCFPTSATQTSSTHATATIGNKSSSFRCTMANGLLASAANLFSASASCYCSVLGAGCMLCVDKTHQIAVFDGSRLPSDLPQLTLTLTLTLALALWGSRMGPPMVPVSLEQVRCRFRAPGSAGVIWEVRWRIIIPCFQNRRGRFPRRFHHVGTME